MATLLDKIRAKQAELQAKNSGGGKNPMESKWIWKPQPGKNRIRIIPFPGEELPFLSVYMESFDVVKNSFMVSPLTYGNPDPIDAFFREAANGKKGDEWKTLIKLAPSSRTFIPIIVRGLKQADGTTPPDQVKFFGVSDGGPKSMLNRIMALYENSEAEEDEDASIELHDINNGYDILFDYIPQDKSKGVIASYEKLEVSKKQTPAAKDPAILELITNGLPTKEELFVEPTYEQLMEKLEKYLKPKPQTPVAGVPTVNPELSPETPVKNLKTEVTDDMFDDFI